MTHSDNLQEQQKIILIFASIAACSDIFIRSSFDFGLPVFVILLLYASAIFSKKPYYYIIAVATPNLALFAFFRTGSYNFMVFFSIRLIILSAIVFFQKFSLNELQIFPDNKIGSKKEINEMQYIINFGLLGCAKEKNNVLSLAYHTLKNCFNAKNAVVFIANEQKKTLVPVFSSDVRHVYKKSLLVNPSFFHDNYESPSKGILKLISKRGTAPSIRELVPGSDIDAFAAMPLCGEKSVIGMVAIINIEPDKLEFFDLNKFVAFSFVLAAAIENSTLHEVKSKILSDEMQKAKKASSTFAKFVSQNVADELLNSKTAVAIGGATKKITVMYADLRGFTELSSHVPTSILVKILNDWLEKASDLIIENGGTIDKYLGDGIMVLFGAPVQKPADALNAIHTAFRLKKQFEQFVQTVIIPSRFQLGLGISAATGEAIVGNFGSSTRMDYTAIGETVNLAARLEKIALPGEIIINKATFDELPNDRFKYSIERDLDIKGIARQPVYKLLSIRNN